MCFLRKLAGLQALQFLQALRADIFPLENSDVFGAVEQGLGDEGFDAQEVAANQVNTMDKLVDLGDNNVFSALGMGSAMFGKDNKND